MRAIVAAGAWMRALDGWRRAGFAFLMGAVSATAFAPLYIFPALQLGFAALALLLESACASPRPILKAALVGWAFMFGQFLIGFHWIGYAFLVDPGAHLWQLPFAVTLLPFGLALFGALALGIVAAIPRAGTARLVLLAVFYAVAEWLRGHLFTGFPWNLPAYGWGASLAILQGSALVGAYGLSFLTVLLGISLAGLSRRRVVFPLVMTLLFALLWGYGALRLATSPGDVPGVQVRIVQPSIPQREKYMPALLARNWQRLIDLSEAPAKAGAPQPNVIVWPESAPPFALARVPAALDEIALLTSRGTRLLTGAERGERRGSGIAFFNSFYMFGPGARVLGIYDKSHLVPFGEYVPFASLLNRIGITKLTAGQSGFTAGNGPRLYHLPGLPAVTPLICYEVIFPGAVTMRQKRPGWFVNVTDDSWFGPWAGPRQHLLIAQVRAIEEGVPILRAANTGISAAIDAHGRVIASLPLNESGVMDTALPRTLAPTLYAHFGDNMFVLLLIAASLFAWRTKRR